MSEKSETKKTFGSVLDSEIRTRPDLLARLSPERWEALAAIREVAISDLWKGDLTKLRRIGPRSVRVVHEILSELGHHEVAERLGKRPYGRQRAATKRLLRAVRSFQALESTGSDLQDAIDELVAATRERFPEFEKEAT